MNDSFDKVTTWPRLWKQNRLCVDKGGEAAENAVHVHVRQVTWLPGEINLNLKKNHQNRI